MEAQMNTLWMYGDGVYFNGRRLSHVQVEQLVYDHFARRVADPDYRDLLVERFARHWRVIHHRALEWDY